MWIFGCEFWIKCGMEKMVVIVWLLFVLFSVVGLVIVNLRCGICVWSMLGVGNCVLNVEFCVRIVLGINIRDMFILSCG